MCVIESVRAVITTLSPNFRNDDVGITLSATGGSVKRFSNCPKNVI